MTENPLASDNMEPGEELFRGLIGWGEDLFEEQWAFRAITEVVNKIKNYDCWKEILLALEIAVKNPMVVTKCVLVNACIDPTVTVFLQRLYLHFITCKLWRWPNLMSHHELIPASFCPHSFSKRLMYMCINPYHYGRPYMVLSNDMVNPLSPLLPPLSLPLRPQRLEMPMPQLMQCDNVTSTLIYTKHLPFPYSSLVIPQLAPTPPLVTANQHKTSHSNQPKWVNSTWLTVTYFEDSVQVGEIFEGRATPIQVDGYCSPQVDFCQCLNLGRFFRRRSSQVTKDVRRLITDGLLIWYSEGEIFIKCLSKFPIYLQSGSCNLLYNMDKNDSLKLMPDSVVKVYNEDALIKLMNRKIREGSEAIIRLRQLFTTRISFVKRLKIVQNLMVSAPCWVEITFHQPLKKIDKFLDHFYPRE